MYNQTIWLCLLWRPRDLHFMLLKINFKHCICCMHCKIFSILCIWPILFVVNLITTHTRSRELLQCSAWGPTPDLFSSALVSCTDRSINPNTHVFYGGRKPEHPGTTNTHTGRTCRLHTERTWNPGRSCCETTVLTTKPSCQPTYCILGFQAVAIIIIIIISSSSSSSIWGVIKDVVAMAGSVRDLPAGLKLQYCAPVHNNWTKERTMKHKLLHTEELAKTSHYLLFTLILRYQVERDGVERAGHDTEHAAEDECGNEVGEEANQAGAHAEYKVAHEVQSLQADVWEKETLHIWNTRHTDIEFIELNVMSLFQRRSILLGNQN